MMLKGGLKLHSGKTWSDLCCEHRKLQRKENMKFKLRIGLLLAAVAASITGLSILFAELIG